MLTVDGSAPKPHVVIYLETDGPEWLAMHRGGRCPFCDARVAEVVGKEGTGFQCYGAAWHCGVLWYAHEV